MATKAKKQTAAKTAKVPGGRDKVPAGGTAAMPDVLGGVVPYLVVDGATRASAFYQRAFGAREMFRHPPDDKGRTMHIHLHLNGGSLMLCDAYPEHGHPYQAAQGFTLHMKVDGIDAWWDRAVAAGAEVVLPVQVMFWGDRYGQLRDPFGVMWSMGEPQSKA
jgi:uncharacterized glyoxalase superfamily protein PhnB